MKSFLLIALRLFLTSLVIGALAGLIGALTLGSNPAFGWMIGFSVAMEVGYPLGLIASIILLKTVFHCPGSLWLGLIGVLVGLGITAALGFTFQNDAQYPYLIACFILAPVVLGAAGYSFGGRKKG